MAALTSLADITPTSDFTLLGHVLSKADAQIGDGYHSLDIILQDHLATVYVQIRADTRGLLMGIANLFEVDEWYELTNYENIPASSNVHAGRCESTIVITDPDQVSRAQLMSMPDLSIAQLRHLRLFHRLDMVYREQPFRIAAIADDQIMYKGCVVDACAKEIVRSMEGQWRCTSCGNESANFVTRYRLMVLLENGGVTIPATGSEALGEALLGMPAAQFYEMANQEPELAAANLEGAVGRLYRIRFRIHGFFNDNGTQALGFNGFTILSAQEMQPGQNQPVL